MIDINPDSLEGAQFLFYRACALQALGYSLADADAAARAFRRHWAGDEATAELTDADKAMLHCLVERKAGG